MRSPNPKSRTRIVSLAATLDSNDVREIWNSSIDKLVMEGTDDAAGIRGTSDYIPDLARRIFPSGIHQEGLEWEVADGEPLAPYVGFLSLLFGKPCIAR